METIFEHNGIRFAYESVGQGVPVVFTHGLGGDRFQPQSYVGDLSEHQFVTWDTRGHGNTQPVGPADGFSFDQFALDLRCLLDALKIKRCILGGISMGAGVAIRFATHWPERVMAMTLVRPAWLNASRPPGLEVLRVISRLIDAWGPEEGLKVFQAMPEIQHIREQAPATAQSLCEQFTKPGSVERSVRLDRMTDDAPIIDWDEIRPLTMPALVIGHKRDPMHPFEYAKQWAKNLASSRLIEIPDKSTDAAGHQFAFRCAFTNFLKEVSS